MKKILFVLIMILAFANGQIRKDVQEIMGDAHDDTNNSLRSILTTQNDGLFDAVVVASTKETEIYNGNHFTVAGVFTLGTANDTSLVVIDASSSTKYAHLSWEFGGLVGTTVLITTGGEFVRSPDALTIVNSDGNSSTESVLDSVYAVYEDSTLATRYGSTLFTHSFGALQSISGFRILPVDSLMVFKVTTDVNTNKVYYILSWSEHTSDE